MKVQLRAAYAPRCARSWQALTLAVMLSLLGYSLPVNGAEICAEPNDDALSACTISHGTVVTATLDRPDDIDVYRIVVKSDSTEVGLELTDLPADYDLYLTDASGGIVGQSVHEGTAPEQIQVTLNAGTYYAVVKSDRSREVDPTSNYTLKLTAVALPRPVAGERRTLLIDRFDDPANGSLPSSSANPNVLEQGYVDGEYELRNVDPANRGQGVRIPGTFAGATLSIDVRLLGATAGRFVGLQCQRRPVLSNVPPSVTYTLRVYPSSQSFELTRTLDGQQSIILPRQSSPAIHPGNAWNTFEFRCTGDTLSAVANERELGSTSEGSDHWVGFFLYIVGVPGEMPHAQVRLDNLVVYSP